jgi:hypothetical protein
LPLDHGEIYRTAINARWRSSLESINRKSKSLKLFRNIYDRMVARTTSRNLRVESDMNPTAQKRARREDN